MITSKNMPNFKDCVNDLDDMGNKLKGDMDCYFIERKKS